MSLDVDITWIIVICLMLVPVLVLNAVIFRPFLRLFVERHEQMEGAVKRAEDMLEQAEAQAKTFEEKIQVATSRGIDARNKIRSEATETFGARLDAERKAFEAKLAGAIEQIKANGEKAMAEVHVDAKKIARLTATKMLGREI